MTAALLAALIAVESGGNDLAVGDHGRALGALQIQRSVVQDVNRHFGTTYAWSQMTNRTAAIKVADGYFRIYGGKNPTDEKLARIWNGGPAGDKKAATLSYWERVKRKLK